jgi:NAD(P)-dependent dehydrogenase (short-subunit alcohol dehydrogenase family)
MLHTNNSNWASQRQHLLPFRLFFWIACVSTLITTAATATTMSLRNVVITGANRGLGLELCKQLCGDERYQKIYALCRQTSPELSDLAQQQQQGQRPNKIEIVPGIDVTEQEIAGAKLQSLFRSDTADPIPIHLLIHNAGAYGPPEESVQDYKDMYASQSLEQITPARMRYALELNALAPLFVTQALLRNLRAAAAAAAAAAVSAVSTASAEPGNNETLATKVIIISSLMGSIQDNESGSHYGYRAAKAAANMIGKSLATDLQSDQIAVGLIHPGFVATGFGGTGSSDGNGNASLERREGQREVDVSVTGVLQAIEEVTMKKTGCFLHGGYGEGVSTINW